MSKGVILNTTTTRPLPHGTKNMTANVRQEFRDACVDAAWDARLKISDWMREAFVEKLVRQGKTVPQ